MFSIGQNDFRNRLKDNKTGTESGLDFHVWYHDDDVSRMLWTLYQKNKNKIEKVALKPFAFMGMVQSEGWYSFANFMGLAKEALLAEEKRYFPFIIKPDPLNAHFCAGLIVQNTGDEKATLFLFNPFGIDKQNIEAYKKKLTIKDENDFMGMKVVFSSHVIQDVKKERESLSSCGPLCIEFIRCALESPEWINSLDHSFQLPETLMAYTIDDPDAYKNRILGVRKEHDKLLAEIDESTLEDVDNFHAPNNEYYMDMPPQHCVEMDGDDEIEDNVQDDFFLPVDAQKKQGTAILKKPETPPEPKKPNGIEAVENEIVRLKTTVGCFSNGLAKAQSIELALKAAIANPKVVDVRQDIDVRKALGYHRIFSFFGYLNARALDNVDKSYEQDQSNVKNAK